MAIVNERHAASKPIQVDPKTGKPLPATAVPPRSGSPSLDPMSDTNGGFFGSFFASKNKKKMAAMEPPPSTLKASGTLSDRENSEVEVISMFSSQLKAKKERKKRNERSSMIIYVLTFDTAKTELLINSYYNIVKRTMIDMVPKAVMLNLVQYVFLFFLSSLCFLLSLKAYPATSSLDIYVL